MSSPKDLEINEEFSDFCKISTKGGNVLSLKTKINTKSKNVFSLKDMRVEE